MGGSPLSNTCLNGVGPVLEHMKMIMFAYKTGFLSQIHYKRSEIDQILIFFEAGVSILNECRVD